jgi:hypothetical protein
MAGGLGQRTERRELQSQVTRGRVYSELVKLCTAVHASSSLHSTQANRLGAGSSL